MPRIDRIKDGNVVFLSASHIKGASGSSHCFTTRLGGVSRGYLDSLNLGLNRGDETQNVIENFNIICSKLGLDYKNAVFSKQTHGDRIKIAGKEDAGAGLLRSAGFEADAYITNTPGLVLTVFTADCAPILLYDPAARVAAAVHAGWRGTANGILYKTVLQMGERFGCLPGNILAAIGPSIGACCFETDGDVPDAMLNRFGERARAYMTESGGKWHVDIKGLNALHLANAGLKPENVAVSEDCTVCESGLYWSHRRDGALRGSQAGIIALT